jgi:hypothetical protein
MFCLPHRDDAALLSSFCPNDFHNGLVAFANRNKPILTIVLPVVSPGEVKTRENCRDVFEVEIAFAEYLEALSLVVDYLHGLAVLI